jgi:hypothetical protein
MHGPGEMTIDFREYKFKISGSWKEDKFDGSYVVLSNSNDL